MPLDIALGIFIALGLARFSGTSADWPFIVTGVFFALLPDADFIITRLRGRGRGKWAHEHRDLFHKPLGYIPVGAALLFPFGLGELVPLFVLASLAHFAHDMVGMGWGVKLFWPFSNLSWKFFAASDRLFGRKLVVRWTDEEVRQFAGEHGDDRWIQNMYLRPHPLGLFEYAMLVLAIIFLFLQ